MINEASIVFPIAGNNGENLTAPRAIALQSIVALAGGATLMGVVGLFDDGQEAKQEEGIRALVASDWQRDAADFFEIARQFAIDAHQDAVYVNVPGHGVKYVTRHGGAYDDYATALMSAPGQGFEAAA